jgi:hypothetical protein
MADSNPQDDAKQDDSKDEGPSPENCILHNNFGPGCPWNH